MPDVLHRNIVNAELHKDKGEASASLDEVYVADGSGSGTWQTASTTTRGAIKKGTAHTSLSGNNSSGTPAEALETVDSFLANLNANFKVIAVKINEIVAEMEDKGWLT